MIKIEEEQDSTYRLEIDFNDLSDAKRGKILGIFFEEERVLTIGKNRIGSVANIPSLQSAQGLREKLNAIIF